MPIKANKLAGIRLINHHEDSINIKDHKDKILDFWILFKSKEAGFQPQTLKDFRYFEKLPNPAKEAYEKWFNSYDFQNEDDKEWVKWIDGKLNFFYHTSNPTEMAENTWYVYFTKAEQDALDIVNTQIFHGNPEVEALWKVETNIKSNEVAGRRNGYIYSSELEKTNPNDTKGFYWAVVFQAPDSVKLFYKDGNIERSKIISWAADCKNMTLLQITSNGRFVVKQTFNKGKAGKPDKYIPQSRVPSKAYVGYALAQYFKKYYFEMYGINEEIEEEVKIIKQAINERKMAVGTFNDEQIKIGRLIKDINDFIEKGNVSPQRREQNKIIRKHIRQKGKLREQKIRAAVREAKKYKKKMEKKARQKLNPLISKK
jgi:hypothetical protein